MKIKISKQRTLYIERAGKFKMQFCPFQENEATCCDLCPLFNDTKLHSKHHQWKGDTYIIDSPTLKLCHTTYSDIVEVIDERKK